MEPISGLPLVSLDIQAPIWEHVFTVAPLVLVGTEEEEGYDFAPKHMVTPLGWDNYVGFVCTPRHRTYHNAKRTGVFTMTYVRPSQVLLASLAASERSDGPGAKPALQMLSTFPAEVVAGQFVEDGYLFLECELDRVVDDFGVNSLLCGRIVAAHVHEEALRISEADDAERLFAAPLLAYLHPGRYATLAETHAFPFPARFSR
ncbi:MAG: flavin reductase [Rhodothermaceae bacterium]|nr:flavin reductase [Rhodothermaceae bacterium]